MPKIHAGFKNMLLAGKAVEGLKNMGYKDAHLDAAENFFEEYSEDLSFSGCRKAPSLSALVLRSRGNLYSIGKGPLITADPMVSGMGPYPEMADNMCTKIIVNVSDEETDKVKDFLRESGGTFNI